MNTLEETDRRIGKWRGWEIGVYEKEFKSEEKKARTNYGRFLPGSPPSSSSVRGNGRNNVSSGHRKSRTIEEKNWSIIACVVARRESWE